MVSPDMKIEKIDHRAIANPIDDIADGAADDEADGESEEWARTRLSQ